MSPGPESEGNRFVVFEGVDGVGKTLFANALGNYYREHHREVPLYIDRALGSAPGSLGEWVHNLRRERAVGVTWRSQSLGTLRVDGISSLALEVLEVAAHVDTISRSVEGMLHRGAQVVLDRFWWSVYVRARRELDHDGALSLVAPERTLWSHLPHPTVLYLRRQESRKPEQLDPLQKVEMEAHYGRLIEEQRAAGVTVHEVSNETTVAETWEKLLRLLDLPFRPIDFGFERKPPADLERSHRKPQT